ncbi:MAG: ASKHA domain-containing protein, partial [Chloroflexota bacterium]
AGAFGSFLNIENAIAIGLFPDLPNAVYRQVGNAAAIGAKWILVSKAARQRGQQIQKQTSYNELTTYPKFNRVFALGMLFPEIDIKKE